MTVCLIFELIFWPTPITLLLTSLYTVLVTFGGVSGGIEHCDILVMVKLDHILVKAILGGILGWFVGWSHLDGWFSGWNRRRCCRCCCACFNAWSEASSCDFGDQEWEDDHTESQVDNTAALQDKSAPLLRQPGHCPIHDASIGCSMYQNLNCLTITH